MEKKLIKAIIDVVKDVKDRPSVWGAEIDGAYIYFTDGYIAVRLKMGEYEGLRPFTMCKDVWVGGEQLNGLYKSMTAKDVCTQVHNDDVGNHVDLVKFWDEWVKDREITDQTAINPEAFKKLAPFGAMLMTITKGKNGGGKLVQFKGKGVQAIACPLTKQMEEELCKYQ